MYASNPAHQGVKTPSPCRLKNEAEQFRLRHPHLKQVAALNEVAKGRGWPSYKAYERAWRIQQAASQDCVVTLSAQWFDRAVNGGDSTHAHRRAWYLSHPSRRPVAPGCGHFLVLLEENCHLRPRVPDMTDKPPDLAEILLSQGADLVHLKYSGLACPERRIVVANRHAPAHEFLNPGTPDLMVMAVPHFHVTEALFNLGNGWRDHFCCGPQPLHVLPPDTPYAWRVNGKSLTVMLAFPMADVSAILKELDAPDPMASLWAVMDRGFVDPMVYEIIMRLWMRTRAGEPCPALLLQSYQVAILSALTGRGSARPTVSNVRAGLQSKKLNAVLDFIESRLGDDLGLSELAAVCDMSRFHFVRMFRQSTGYTPYRYLLLRRLEKARALLIAGEKPVAEVALESGFGDAGHFSRTFARHIGMSPQRYRASAR